MKILPVTLVSGFLSAGKTSLLNHLITNRGDLKVAVIANDRRGAVPVAVTTLTAGVDKVVPMPGGCICCTLREELLLTVARLASEQKYDYLFIECLGVGEPEAVAEVFRLQDKAGNSLSNYARIDTAVTVVDATTFLEEYSKVEYLVERGLALNPADDRTTVELLVHQVEFANVIVLNKSDRILPEYLPLLLGLLQKLNPTAEVIQATRGVIPPEKVINTRTFDFDTASQVADYVHEKHDDPPRDTDKTGVSSFVYRARRPFHPKRFMAFLHQAPATGLLRAKGLFWLASRMHLAGQLSLTGGACQFGSAGYWLAALSEEEARADAEQWEAAQTIWDEEWGDRRQELAFIGFKMDRAALIKLLDAALMDDAEMKQSPAAWAVMEDPFGEWDLPRSEPFADED